MTALNSIVARPLAFPVKRPRSVPDEEVVHVRAPYGEGDVNLRLFENTVPFVVPLTFSISRVPPASTTTGLSTQLLRVRVLIGPPTLVPVTVDMVPWNVDSSHVLANPASDVVVMSVEVPVSREAWIVTPEVFFTPLVSSVVAEAVLAYTIRASAAKTAGPSLFKIMILSLF